MIAEDDEVEMTTSPATATHYSEHTIAANGAAASAEDGGDDSLTIVSETINLAFRQ